MNVGRASFARTSGASFAGRGGFDGAAGWRGGGWGGGWGGWRGGGWGGWNGGWGWGVGAGLAGFALGVTFGNPYWSPYWSPYWGWYGWGAPYVGYWGADYGYWNPYGYADWSPDYVGYWDDPGYWGADYGYVDWRPRLWRQYRRPVAAVTVQPAAYRVAVAYNAPADCGGAHYVWDDYVGGWVFRPYSFAC